MPRLNPARLTQRGSVTHSAAPSQMATEIPKGLSIRPGPTTALAQSRYYSGVAGPPLL